MGNKLNTVAKGDAFEDMVFIKMKELLESDMLGLSPNHSKIFQKKEYQGKTGNKIIFDIAIESYHPNSDECSTLTLIECKDYNYPIQVEKLRSFAASIDDVGGNKGYFITTSHFQLGAINHAKSCKIGLAKFSKQNLDVEKWVLRRVGYLNHQKRQTIQEELYSSKTSQNDFVSICDYDYYSNFLDFVAEQFIGKPCKINVEYLTDDAIKLKASELIAKMQYKSDMPRSTELLTNIVAKELNLKLILDQSIPDDDLGMCDFGKKSISISSQLQYDSPRWRFTLAHEIGHFVLHESICSNHMVNSISDNETSINSVISDNALSRLEIQANKFASNLLIPEDTFKACYALRHKQLGLRNYPFLYLDNQPCNINDCRNMFSYLGGIFNISAEMIKIKLKDLGYLTINESTKSIRDVFR